MRILKDMLGRAVSLPERPLRVISLCPSQTETLVDLGIGERLVGRTRFCIHPKEKLKSVARVGGTKEVDMEKIHALQPDLIIGEKEENTPEMVAELEKHYPVLVTDVTDYASALTMIQLFGDAVGEVGAAKHWIERIETEWKAFSDVESGESVAYLIWRNPWMAVGKNTFIHSVLEKMGFRNVCEGFAGRYPVLDDTHWQTISPGRILLSSEPYPFKAQHIAEIQAFQPKAKVSLVDGEMFSWYGTRMAKAAEYLANWKRNMESDGEIRLR